MGKRGPRNPGPALHTLPGADRVVDVRERPPVAWNRLVLTEAQGAEFLQMARSTFRSKAVAGEFPRYWTGGEWRYYAYDLLDWLLESRRQGE